MILLYSAKDKVEVGAVDRSGAVWVSSRDKDIMKPLTKLRKTELGKKKPTHIVLCQLDNTASPEHRATWSQLRGTTTVANTLAFAFGVPVHRIEVGEKTTKKQRIALAVAEVHQKKVTGTSPWLTPTYDGEPNITTP